MRLDNHNRTSKDMNAATYVDAFHPVFIPSARQSGLTLPEILGLGRMYGDITRTACRCVRSAFWIQRHGPRYVRERKIHVLTSNTTNLRTRGLTRLEKLGPCSNITLMPPDNLATL
jgi:hypothetical protein